MVTKTMILLRIVGFRETAELCIRACVVGGGSEGREEGDGWGYLLPNYKICLR